MTLLDRLQRLSAAEEFFVALGLDYDPQVLAVNRLHVLKRFSQYMVGEQLAGISDAQAAARLRTLLARAYSDCLSNSPQQQKLFKVFRDAEGEQRVSVESLRASLRNPLGAARGGLSAGLAAASA